jgi:hypothetical protein
VRTHDIGRRRQGAALSLIERGRFVPTLVIFVALAMLLVVSVTSCSSKEPPEDTVSGLGKAVGDAKLDDVDFEAVLSAYASEGYRTNTEKDQANYQLYLLAKAAESGLGEPNENIQVTSDVSGNDATVSFVFVTPEGLFAVADVGKIDVDLVYTESPENPWRIEKIQLSR